MLQATVKNFYGSSNHDGIHSRCMQCTSHTYLYNNDYLLSLTLLVVFLLLFCWLGKLVVIKTTILILFVVAVCMTDHSIFVHQQTQHAWARYSKWTKAAGNATLNPILIELSVKPLSIREWSCCLAGHCQHQKAYTWSWRTKCQLCGIVATKAADVSLFKMWKASSMPAFAQEHSLPHKSS